MQDNNLPALLPCPFCGANPHTGLSETKEHANSGEKYQHFVIRCPKKHATVSNTKELAIREWNTRAPSALQAEHGKAVDDRIEAYCKDVSYKIFHHKTMLQLQSSLSASIALNQKLVEGLINIRRKAVAGFGGDYGDKHGEIYELAHALLELAKQHGVE